MALLVAAMCVTVGPGVAPGRDVPVPQRAAFAAEWDRVRFDHGLWTAVLSDHVDASGLVDYGAVRQDARFLEYLHRLGQTDPAGFGDAAGRKAFWINAYNALVIQGVVETLPKDRAQWPAFSVLDVEVPGIAARGKGFFQGLRFQVGGRRYTLDEIEKAVLLQRPEWVKRDVALYASVGVPTPDPRIHFALVCAARGCPKLAREAYEPDRLDAQLEAAARRFARDTTQVRAHRGKRLLELSQLMSWYGEDFTNPRHRPTAGSVPAFLSRYVEEPDLARALATERWDIHHVEYDWKLNVQR